MASKFAQNRSMAPALVEQRRAARHPVQLTREVRTADFGVQEALLRDVSSYGCRFDAPGAFAIGERIWLRLADNASTAATVVWSDGTHTGCRFDKPIERQLMRTLTLAIH